MIGHPSAPKAAMWVVGGCLRVDCGWDRRPESSVNPVRRLAIDTSKLWQNRRMMLCVSSVALTDPAEVGLGSRSPATGEHPRNKVIVSPESIRRAAEIVQTIEQLQVELTGLFGGASAAAPAPKRRGRPPGVRAAAQAEPAQGRTRNMSPEGRARIAAAAKARWARVRAEKAKAAKKAA